MFSSKIYKSGSTVNVKEVVLKQQHSPQAIKELLEFDKINKAKKKILRSEDDVRAGLLKIEKDAYDKGFQACENAGLKLVEPEPMKY
jgi:hypothetical protein